MEEHLVSILVEQAEDFRLMFMFVFMLVHTHNKNLLEKTVL
ncbi:Hypothetical Protein CTN_0055 [Thermotoga neapolitana DSM 4359]|uniref:Uncharacterized protein n=1 Tax=Thermotoga neapolitana (strain ATCC 49049 / DSM 4359 / NBRC 107923 / NS-E) TaxID=309803 RepID=B9KB34_THENN|nr:Hypothetical Protein CTN_0055 [Thermotoga neapolitana DSM 4359]